MQSIQSQISINRPKAEIWAILSDLTAMGNYMPGIKDVHLTSETEGGVGAARYCTFEDGIELHERVVDWNEGEEYSLETTKFVKAPMRENKITFSLAAEGDATVVTQTMRYAMKGGIFAPIMEMMAKGMMAKAINGALSGLKTYAEARS